MIFLLGSHANPPEEKFNLPASHHERFLRPETVDQAFSELRAHWEGLLSVIQVETPDPHTNRMVNIWNPYQCMVTFNIARSASLFGAGISRGIGAAPTKTSSAQSI